MNDAQLHGPRTELVRVREVQEWTVMELRGEIDLAAMPEILPHLDDVTATPAPTVVIDLTPTDFFDCSGLRLLVRARRRVDERSGRLVLVCPHEMPRRILRAAGLSHCFRVVDTISEVCPTPEVTPEVPAEVAAPWTAHELSRDT
ncbi:anti-sigma factor antagonist [Streptomyces sp. NPDC050264]|uniref:anti-sigma factor antagonist n=1 Tax=Streptomyces sp. NPDC050264 TaxID=3155038 RepID=UPI003415C9B2